MKLNTAFFNDIRELILSARITVAHGVDLVQVHTNFEIGRRIILQEQKGKNRAAYGKEVIKTLAERLSAEFGKGFSLSNLKSMRQFYLQNQHRIGQTTSGQLAASSKSQTVSGPLPIPGHGALKPFTLSWSHYVFLLGIKNPDERSFYEIEATQQNWTVRELKRQFDRQRSFEVPKVMPKQQQEAVTKLDSLSDETQRLVNLYQRKLAALDALKKSLLHQAFTSTL